MTIDNPDVARERYEANLKVTALPPLNNRPLGFPRGRDLSKGRGIVATSLLQSDMEGPHIEFWRAEVTVGADYIIAEDALELIIRTRSAVHEILHGERPDDEGIRELIAEAIDCLVTPGQSDAVVRYLRHHITRRTSGADVELLAELLDEYRESLA